MNITYSRASVKVINSMDKASPGTYRLRVGDWRILFSYPEDGIILIEKIGPRGDVYK